MGPHNQESKGSSRGGGGRDDGGRRQAPGQKQYYSGKTNSGISLLKYKERKDKKFQANAQLMKKYKKAMKAEGYAPIRGRGRNQEGDSGGGVSNNEGDAEETGLDSEASDPRKEKEKNSATMMKVPMMAKSSKMRNNNHREREKDRQRQILLRRPRRLQKRRMRNEKKI
jgi:hypothetical protein